MGEQKLSLCITGLCVLSVFFPVHSVSIRSTNVSRQPNQTIDGKQTFTHTPDGNHGPEETAKNPSKSITHETNQGYGGRLVNETDYTENGVHGDAGNTSHHGGQAGVTVIGFNFAIVQTPAVVCIVILFATLTKLAFHHAEVLSSRLPESCLLIVIGVILGAIIHFTGGSNILPAFFESHEFFLYLLPPIILEASFSLHNRDFFNNIKGILVYAVIGTTASCFIIGYSLYGLAIAGAMGDITISVTEVLLFSALICAVDPVAVLSVFEEVGVNNALYFLVFGESLLNDGVTVVIYKVMQQLNKMDHIDSVQIVLGIVAFFVVAGGGLIIGIILGAMCAFVTKFTNSVRVVEPIAVYCFAYLSFLLAEIFELSGIISIIAFGLVQRQYTFFNITDKSRTSIEYFIKVIATTNEIIVFLFLGLALVRPDHNFHVGFILWTLLLILVIRFFITFLLTYFLNRFDNDRAHPISFREQFIISYGGLRGAVAFSLVALLTHEQVHAGDEVADPNTRMFVTATLAVVIFTVFIQGITIKPFVALLEIGLANREQTTFFVELNSQIQDEMILGIEAVVGSKGHHYLRKYMQRLDEKLFKRWLLKYSESSDEEIFRIYSEISLREHMESLKACGVKVVTPSNSIKEAFGKRRPAVLSNARASPERNGNSLQDLDIEADHVQTQREHSTQPQNDVKTAFDLRKMLYQSNKQNSFRYDRNLTKEEDKDVLTQQLEEKRQRLRRLKSKPMGLRSALRWGLPQAGHRRRLSQTAKATPGRTKSLGDLEYHSSFGASNAGFSDIPEDAPDIHAEPEPEDASDIHTEPELKEEPDTETGNTRL